VFRRFSETGEARVLSGVYMMNSKGPQTEFWEHRVSRHGKKN